MPEPTTVLQHYLSEEAIKALLGAGVVIGGIWVGIWRFGSGGKRADRVETTPESDMRNNLTVLSAESRRMHGETHDRLEALAASIAVLMDRTSR